MKTNEFDYECKDDMLSWYIGQAPLTDATDDPTLLAMEKSAQQAVNEVATWIANVVDDPSGNIIQDLDAAVNQARAEGIEEGKKVVERWLEFMMLSNDDLAYAAVYGLYQFHYKNGAIK